MGRRDRDIKRIKSSIGLKAGSRKERYRIISVNLLITYIMDDILIKNRHVSYRLIGIFCPKLIIIISI